MLYRKSQQLQRRFNWNVTENVWSPLSWFVTITLISLGWVFFRANSLLQAERMLSALLSPATYVSHVLTLNLYYLIATLPLGYAVVLQASAALDSYATDLSVSESSLLANIARRRWFWLPPLYAVALLLISFVTIKRGGTAAQLMYRSF